MIWTKDNMLDYLSWNITSLNYKNEFATSLFCKKVDYVCVVKRKNREQ